MVFVFNSTIFTRTMNQKKPSIIQFDSIGGDIEGYISVAEFARSMPFPVKRVYWVHSTPDNQERGNHANLENKTIVVCLNGSVEVQFDDLKNNVFHYKLENPKEGLLIPSNHWKKFVFSENAVLLCLCSEKYLEADYIRDFKIFTRMKYDKKASIV